MEFDLDRLPTNKVEARRWVKHFWHQHLLHADSMFIAHLENPALNAIFAQETQRLAQSILPKGELSERTPIIDDIKGLINLAGPRGHSERELRQASLRFRKLDKETRKAILVALIESGRYVYRQTRKEGRSGPSRLSIIHVAYANAGSKAGWKIGYPVKP